MPGRSHIQTTQQDDAKKKVRTKKRRELDKPGQQKTSSMLKAPLDTAMRQQMAKSLQNAVGNQQVQRSLTKAGSPSYVQAQDAETSPIPPHLAQDQERMKELGSLTEEIDRYLHNDYERLLRVVTRILVGLQLLFDPSTLPGLREEIEAWTVIPASTDTQALETLSSVCVNIREQMRRFVQYAERRLQDAERGLIQLPPDYRMGNDSGIISRGMVVLEVYQESRTTVAPPGEAQQAEQQNAGAGGAGPAQQTEQTGAVSAPGG